MALLVAPILTAFRYGRTGCAEVTGLGVRAKCAPAVAHCLRYARYSINATDYLNGMWFSYWLAKQSVGTLISRFNNGNPEHFLLHVAYKGAAALLETVAGESSVLFSLLFQTCIRVSLF